jgi:hypothetical protein
MIELKKIKVVLNPSPRPSPKGEGEKGKAGEISVTIQEANAVIGLKRKLLSSEAFTLDPNNKGEMIPVEEDHVRHMLRVLDYPNFVAPVVEIHGLPDPITFEDFANLPEEWLDRWSEAVYTLNPHWLNKPKTETDEKKVQSSGKKSRHS